jgi:hypothetical protein
MLGTVCVDRRSALLYVDVVELLLPHAGAFVCWAAGCLIIAVDGWTDYSKHCACVYMIFCMYGSYGCMRTKNENSDRDSYISWFFCTQYFSVLATVTVGT